jgi:hypothetical protein
MGIAGRTHCRRLGRRGFAGQGGLNFLQDRFRADVFVIVEGKLFHPPGFGFVGQIGDALAFPAAEADSADLGYRNFPAVREENDPVFQPGRCFQRDEIVPQAESGGEKCRGGDDLLHEEIAGFVFLLRRRVGPTPLARGGGPGLFEFRRFLAVLRLERGENRPADIVLRPGPEAVVEKPRPGSGHDEGDHQHALFPLLADCGGDGGAHGGKNFRDPSGGRARWQARR